MSVESKTVLTLLQKLPPLSESAQNECNDICAGAEVMVIGEVGNLKIILISKR